MGIVYPTFCWSVIPPVNSPLEFRGLGLKTNLMSNMKVRLHISVNFKDAY